jgi:hypothetical protein
LRESNIIGRSEKQGKGLANPKPIEADADVAPVERALQADAAQHPRAKIEVYRYNGGSICIRVIDPEFKGLNRVERDNLMWIHLDELPEDARSQVTMVVLLIPGEEKTPLGNLEFSNPSPPLGII